MQILDLILIYASIDKAFVKGMYGINSRNRFLYLVIFKKRIDLNPRYIINLKYLFEQIKEEKIINPIKRYQFFINNIHPYIELSAMANAIHIFRFNVYIQIEKYIQKTLSFPLQRFKETDFSLTFETGPLTILDYINIAGNVFVQEGREIVPTSEFS